MNEREEKLRRVALKCADFARQLSYHLALYKKYRGGGVTLNFWRCMSNNAIDLAVLDWFHLFGSYRDNLHWKNIVEDEEAFKKGLLAELKISEAQWEIIHENVKNYRDKDVAHIEVRPVSHMPDIDKEPLRAANYYYKYILPELTGYSDYYRDEYPKDLIQYHKKSLEEAIKITSIACGATKNIDFRGHHT